MAVAMLDGLKVVVVVFGNPSTPAIEDVDGAGVTVVFENRGAPVLEGLIEVVVLLGDPTSPPVDAMEGAVG